MNSPQNNSQQLYSISFPQSATQKNAKEYAQKKNGGLLFALTFIISFVFLRLVLHGGGFGYSMPILTLLSWVFFLPFIISRDKKFSWTGIFSLIPLAALSIECALFNAGGMVKFITLLTMFVLTIQQNAKISGISSAKLFSWENFKNALASIFVIPFEVVGAAFSSFKSKKEKSRKGSGVIGKILIGLLVSLPAVIFLLCYFSLTDDVFGYYISKALNVFKWDLPSIILDIIGASIITVYLFPQKFGLCVGTERSSENSEKKNRGLDGVFVASFLGSCAVIYLAFVAVQLGYLFNSSLPADIKSSINYSEYARSGFSSLCFITFVTFIVILLSMKITKKNEKGFLPIYLKIILALLALSDLIFVASALMRMSLYVDAYGLTRSRAIGAWFIIVLAICVAAIIIKVSFERLNMLSVAAGMVLIMVIGLNAVNLDAVVARYNVDRYLETGKIDKEYLFNDVTLSAGDELLRLAENEKNPKRSEEYYRYIAGKCYDFEHQRKFGSWTLSEVLNYNKLIANEKIAEGINDLSRHSDNWTFRQDYYCYSPY